MAKKVSAMSLAMGKRIYQLRCSKKLTQAKLAETLNVSTKHMGCVERGESTLSVEKLVDLSNFFDVSLDYIIRGYGEELLSIRHLPQEFLELFNTSSEPEYHLMYEYICMYMKMHKQLK